ncbi:hypothetical protein [Methylorubrum extorquens]
MSDEALRDRPLLMGYEVAGSLAERIGFGPVPAVGSIAADALLGHCDGRATSFSLNRNAYTGLSRYHPAMTYIAVSRATRELAASGWIEIQKGKRWPEGKGRQSRFWATRKLIDLAGDDPILRPRRGEALVMKDSDKNLIGYRDTERTIAMARDVRAGSEAIRSTEIRIEADDIEWRESGFVTVPGLTRANGERRHDILLRPDQIELRRVANNASWREGMRHYGHWCQSLPKERRRQITIGGVPVELLDFGAAHPSLLYAKVGAILDGDPYEVSGFERGEVKLALLIAINAQTRGAAVGALAHRLAVADAEEEDRPTIVEQAHREHAARLLTAVEKRHQPIAGAFGTGVGTGLQFLESEIIGAVMKAARRQGVVTLPVHDELIAKAGREADLVRDLMVEKWVGACGAFPDIAQ